MLSSEIKDCKSVPNMVMREKEGGKVIGNLFCDIFGKI